MRNKKQSKDCNGRLPIPRKVKRGFFFYTAALVALSCCTVTAFVDGDQ